MTDISDLIYDFVSESEVEDAHRLEISAFPPDEAASLDAFKSRQSNAPHLFLAAFLPTALALDLLSPMSAQRSLLLFP